MVKVELEKFEQNLGELPVDVLDVAVANVVSHKSFAGFFL